jgi:hypothetical protein
MSTSASALSRLRQFVRQGAPLALSPIDVLFPSFGICYGIVVFHSFDSRLTKPSFSELLFISIPLTLIQILVYSDRS